MAPPIKVPSRLSGACGTGGAGVREVPGHGCKSWSAFHAVDPAPPVGRRRQRSASASTSGSSDDDARQSDDSLLSKMDRMLLDGAGPGDPAGNSDAEDGAESGPEPVGTSKQARPCKGVRIRYRKFAEVLEMSIRMDPGVDLASLALPRYIQKNKILHGMMMRRLGDFKRALAGTLPPEGCDGGREFGSGAATAGGGPVPGLMEMRVASPGMHRGKPQAKRAASPGRAPGPRGPSQEVLSM